MVARGTRRQAENRALCACRWPLPRLGRLARSASYPLGAPRWGCPWRVPPVSILGCVRCRRVRVWTRSLTHPVSCTVRLAMGDSAGALGLFRVDADTAPFGSEDATPGSCPCVHVRAFLSLFFSVPWCAGCAVLCVAVPWAVGRVGVCCCGLCALAGAVVRLRSVVRCSLPVPPPFVLLLVVLRVPAGAVLAACSSPCCLRWVPCGAAPSPPRPFCVGLCFSTCRVLAGSAPPPGWWWCPLLCFVVRCVLWCCGVWCVLFCARCCVACLCRVGFLRRVVRRSVVLAPVFVVLCCRALLRCLLFFSAMILASSWRSGLFLFLCSACAVLCWCACVNALRALLSCPCCAGWCVVACCVCVSAVGPCCPLLSPGGSPWPLLSCFGGVLCFVPGCCAACCAAWRCVVVRFVVSSWSAWCCGALFRVQGRYPLSSGPMPSGAVLCLVSPRCVCSAVVCCCVVLYADVLCGVCVLGCPAVRSLSSPFCAVLLCAPALPWCPAPWCCALWCCGALWRCGVTSCCLGLVCFLSLFGFSYFENRCKIYLKFFFLKKTFF